MKITLEKLKGLEACGEGIVYFAENYTEIDHADLIKDLIKKDKVGWANWLISRLLAKENKSRYAIYSAELVIHLFEKEHPHDDRPRKAIEAAKNYLNDPTKENRSAAWDSGEAAWSAGHAARAATWTARAATWAAGATACSVWAAARAAAFVAARAAARAAARTAAWAAGNTETAARDVARAAARAAWVAWDYWFAESSGAAGEAAEAADNTAYESTLTKIINYGLTLLDN